MIESLTDVRSTRWRVIYGMWVAGALFEAAQSVLFMRAIGRQHAWLIFATEVASWVPWALATPLVINLARRYEIIRSRSLHAVVVHIAAFAAISLVAETWFAVLQVLFNPWDYPLSPTFLDSWRTSLLFQVLTYLIVYALILTVTYVMDARERIAQQTTETVRLSEALSKSQLAALRQQMEPHFMFNTLHSITGLVRDNKNDAAVSMIVGLSEFLRRGLEDSDRSQVTLQEEVEYLQRYLDIQKVRFGERLNVSLSIPADLLRLSVPSLLLQPLVENAIKHGIAKRTEGGNIRVAVIRKQDQVYVTVYNDGADFPAETQATHTGVGISNLRTRLQILHGDRSDLQLRRAATGAVEVTVVLPLEDS